MTVGEFEIETFSGAFVDTGNPDPSTIALEDIAHALAHTCRFGGHCRTFYSVAEHAVLVSRRLERQGYDTPTLLAGLHHDDSEAYLSDIPRPMKPLLGGAYETLTADMDRAIIDGLALPCLFEDMHAPPVKRADNWAVFIEARHLLPSRGRSWNAEAYGRSELGARLVTPDYWTHGQSPAAAKLMYLTRHESLMERFNGA